MGTVDPPKSSILLHCPIYYNCLSLWVFVLQPYCVLLDFFTFSWTAFPSSPQLFTYLPKTGSLLFTYPFLVEIPSLIICPSILWTQHNSFVQSYANAHNLKTHKAANPRHNKQDTALGMQLFLLSFFHRDWLFPSEWHPFTITCGGGYHVGFSFLLYFNFFFTLYWKTFTILFLGAKNTYFSILIHHHLSFSAQPKYTNK